jgi:tRNA 5-methylaminomethyl-2-thiouridine biosynthesis bifunctional protein
LSRIALSPAAGITFDEAGTPLSTRFGDVYRSRDGAFAEAQAVFVEGTGLPGRWSGLPSFTVLEIGFGLGVNFLTTLSAWRDSPTRPSRLHFVSIEKHPLGAGELAAAHAALGLRGADASRLIEIWPLLTPDLHRLSFADGAVTLWLALGDAQDWLARLRVAADALYLDGFAPSRNPEAWSDPVIRGLARLARPEARLSTFSAARPVAERLRAAGFEVTLRPGFGHKRERIDAVYRPRWRTWPAPPPLPSYTQRSALVIGAGLAGVAVAARLAEDDWAVTLIDAAAGPALGGSAQPLCADHLHVSPDDNLMARATRAALLLARAARARLRIAQQPLLPEGRLQLAADEQEAERLAETARSLNAPEALLRFVHRDEASALAGLELPRAGLWLPGCQLIDPARLAQERIVAHRSRLTTLYGCRVDQLSCEDNLWTARNVQGDLIAQAEIAILCNAGDAGRLGGLRSMTLRRIRGQTSWLDPKVRLGLRCTIGGPAYAVPQGSRILLGATFDEEDQREAPDPASDLSNLRRFARMLGREPARDLGALQAAAVGFRWTASDRMPMIGAMPDERAAGRDATALLRNARLPLPRQVGLYCASALGSRGSLWSELAAEMLASELSGAPCPVANELAAACDPARQLRRHLHAR